MEEERFVEEQIEDIEIAEVNETVIPVIDETIMLSPQNEAIEASVEETEVFNVTISEDVGPHALKIVSDHAFDLPRQHSIGAIEGLREELDEIERLKTVYSDGKNQANYYMWQDENPNQENRDGYFVSIHQKDNKIRICKSDEDEFGVTVSDAGFIGNQNEEISRGSNYGLVVNSGLVSVRCETDVMAGDYVVSDDYGVAKKTDGTYGYLVTAISNVGNVGYAIISLTMPTTQMQKFSEIVQDVDERMDSAEINIATAISVANAAYNKAQVAQEWVQGNVENIAGDVVIIGGKVDEVVTDIDGLKDSVAGSITQSNKAYEIATKAERYVSDTKTYVNSELNAAHTSINNLTDAVAPITTWVGFDENGSEVTGANYFVEHIDESFLKTKTQIDTVQTLTEENQTAISKNAESIQLLATSIDKYSVGEWSQAYGLTLSQAWSILKPGMIYIPTPVTHYEKYVYEIVDIWDEQGKDTSMIYKEKDTGLYWRSIIQKDENDNLTNQWESIDLTTTDDVVFIVDDTQAFTRGYYYTWNGFYWVESESPYVYFSAAYANPSKECQYWYRDTNEDLKHDGITYKAHGLYMIINDKWTEVNILDGNVTNRVASMINQTANSISLDVSNAKGDIADLKLEVGSQGSQIAMVAANSEPSDIQLVGSVESIDLLPTSLKDGVYYAVGQKVYRYNNNEWKEQYHLTYDGVYVKKINAANIIAAVNNDGESIAAINADRINFNGYATFTDDGSGLTGISGDLIHTGTIASNDGTVKIDLGQGTAGISGRVTATSGYIGNAYNGFTIANSGEYVYQVGTKGLPNSQDTVIRPDGSTSIRNYRYSFVVNNVQYAFILRYDLDEGDKIIFNSSDLTMQIYQGDNQYSTAVSIISEINSGIIGTLEFALNGYYYLSNEQTSLIGDSTGNAGVYISPEGIGLGNGNFYVNNEGHLTTQGDVTMKSSNGTDLLKISDGSIQLTGSITWGVDGSPVKVLYDRTGSSQPPNYGESGYKSYVDYDDDSSTDWHKKYDDDYDYYASYSYDGGRNWTDAIKIKGEDGKDTSAAIAEKIANGTYSNGSFINGREIYSPTIYSNQFNVIPEDTTNASGSFNLYSYFADSLCNFLKIYYYAGTSPIIHFSSPGHAYAQWDFGNTQFNGTVMFNKDVMVDFSNANVKGIHPKFA